MNQGKTNSITFLLFIVKLCQHLTAIDKNWRTNTIFMIDNAAYHRAAFTKEKLNALKVPLMYLGPYHFKMAPIEFFFSIIKNHDLNPLKSRISTS